MPRVKRGTLVKKRHRKVLEAASGYFGGKHRLFKTANEQVMHSGAYAYRDRRNKKREFRRLWITRISAACRAEGLTYNRFMEGLRKAGVLVDRKILSDLAIHDAGSFAHLVAQARKALETSGLPAA
jgi:large subunit ribosomal protein L20